MSITRNLTGMIKPSAIALLLGTGLLWACSRPIGNSSSETAQASDQKKPDKALQSFESISGTPYLFAHVVQAGWSKSRALISSSASYDRGGEIRNLVFLDSGSLKSHRLFETNEYVILNTEQHPLSGQAPKAKAKTERFVYQIVKQDTNEDKSLNGADHRTIALSDAFGKQYVEVLTEISQLLNLQPLSSNRMLAVYVKDGQKMASIIDLEQRTVVKSDAIANLGTDVK